MSLKKSVDPLVLINFKTYLEATGKRAVDLSKRISVACRESGVSVALAPQFCDIAQVAAEVDVPVFAQHIDAIVPGASTGHILADSVKAAGADGAILNHSERTIRISEIEAAVLRARELGLTTVVCAGSADSAAALSMIQPDMVAIEPPELIGTGRAVSKEKPEVVTDSVKKIRAVNRSVKILCGAGISTGDDLYAALNLGAEGVILASGVVKSPRPETVILGFCEAVRRFNESSVGRHP